MDFFQSPQRDNGKKSDGFAEKHLFDWDGFREMNQSKYRLMSPVYLLSYRYTEEIDCVSLKTTLILQMKKGYNFYFTDEKGL